MDMLFDPKTALCIGRTFVATLHIHLVRMYENIPYVYPLFTLYGSATAIQYESTIADIELNGEV